MSSHQIHIFISHAWSYSGHYEKLAEWIFNGDWSDGPASLNFHDYSVPKDDPIHNANSVSELQAAIFKKIARSHIIVIPTGMYTNYSKWIKKEIAGANNYRKPILAVTPRGQINEASVVLKHADHHVNWNSKTVVKAIWNLYYRNGR